MHFHLLCFAAEKTESCFSLKLSSLPSPSQSDFWGGGPTLASHLSPAFLSLQNPQQLPQPALGHSHSCQGHRWPPDFCSQCTPSVLYLTDLDTDSLALELSLPLVPQTLFSLVSPLVFLILAFYSSFWLCPLLVVSSEFLSRPTADNAGSHGPWNSLLWHHCPPIVGKGPQEPQQQHRLPPLISYVKSLLGVKFLLGVKSLSGTFSVITSPC